MTDEGRDTDERKRSFHFSSGCLRQPPKQDRGRSRRIVRDGDDANRLLPLETII